MEKADQTIRHFLKNIPVASKQLDEDTPELFLLHWSWVNHSQLETHMVTRPHQTAPRSRVNLKKQKTTHEVARSKNFGLVPQELVCAKSGHIGISKSDGSEYCAVGNCVRGCNRTVRSLVNDSFECTSSANINTRRLVSDTDERSADLLTRTSPSSHALPSTL